MAGINNFPLLVLLIIFFMQIISGRNLRTFVKLTEFDSIGRIISDNWNYIKMKDLPESELIKLSKSGDKEAFAELIKRTSGKIYSLCYRLTGNKENSEDLYQETYIKAFESIKRFMEKSAFSSYLYRIATNLYLNKRRTKKLKTVSMDTPLQGKDGEFERQFPDTASSAEEKIEGNYKETVVQKAIDLIQPEYRSVVLLRFFQGKSHKEISGILKISMGTVASRLSRGIVEMRKQLKPFYEKGIL